VVVNLDPYHRQGGWVELPLRELGISEDRPYQVQDLLGGEWYFWNGGRNFVQLDPHILPAHIFKVHRHVSTERDFPYFM
jgi:starch synthase (maltosyl-transferring)